MNFIFYKPSRRFWLRLRLFRSCGFRRLNALMLALRF